MNNRNPNYYQVLGITPKADEVAIKKAYHKKMMQWHPDKNPNDKQLAEEKTKKIIEAYEVLGDTEKRKQYHASEAPSSVPAKSAFPEEKTQPRPQFTPEEEQQSRRPYLKVWFSEGNLAEIKNVTLKEMIDRCPEDEEQQLGHSPLFYARLYQQRGVLNYCYSKAYAQFKSNHFKNDAQGYTIFDWAVLCLQSQEHIEQLQRQLKLDIRRTGYATSLLQKAVVANSETLAKYFCSKGAHPDVNFGENNSQDGMVSLFWQMTLDSCLSQTKELFNAVKILIHCGANVNFPASRSGVTPIQLAIEYAHDDLLVLLLANNANLAVDNHLAMIIEQDLSKKFKHSLSSLWQVPNSAMNVIYQHYDYYVRNRLQTLSILVLKVLAIGNAKYSRDLLRFTQFISDVLFANASIRNHLGLQKNDRLLKLIEKISAPLVSSQQKVELKPFHI